MYSIRNRLNLTIIGSMVAVLLATAVFLYYRVEVHVVQVFDGGLLDKARSLISLTELDEEGLEFDFAEAGIMPEFEKHAAPEYYEIWESGDTLLLRSPSLGDSDLPRGGVETGRHAFGDVALPDGRHGRLIEIAFMPRVDVETDPDDPSYGEPIPPAKPITMVYARERESLDHTLFVIGVTIFGVTGVVLLLSGLLIWRLVGSGLAPLSNLARQVGAIDESNLAVRLTHEGPQSREIEPIENQLNHLLERLHSAFERERRFSANVAHELRTPLSELKTLAEVSSMVPEDRAEIQAFFDDVGAISTQMENIVITLLELARSEAGLLRADPEDIELRAYCDEIWRQVVNGGGTDRILVAQVPGDLVINTDREKLGMILTNLFTNAISYSPRNAEIEITAEIRNGRVVLEVRNASSDLRPEDIVHMKDRFWRKHKTGGESGHSGLGLTLVDALARIMQLDVSLSLDQERIFRVIISGLTPATPRH